MDRQAPLLPQQTSKHLARRDALTVESLRVSRWGPRSPEPWREVGLRRPPVGLIRGRWDSATAAGLARLRRFEMREDPKTSPIAEANALTTRRPG